MAAKRRARGQGYVSEDAKRGQWRATVPLAGGRTRTRYFGDAASAEAWRADQVAALAGGQNVARGKQPIKLALAELLADRAYVRPGTLTSYRYHARLITARLGAIACDGLTPEDVSAFDQWLRRDRAAGTAEQVINLLASLYQRLLAYRAVAFDPVAAYRTITPLRARGGRPSRPPIVLALPQCQELIAAIDDERLGPMIAWLVCLPFRISELRGLRWVNVRGGVAHVVEQRTHADPWTATAPKSPAGVRLLPIAPALLTMTPREENELGLVFPNEVGGPVYDETLRVALDRVLARAKKLPRVRVHDLRHTAASGILSCGAPHEYVRALLGHEPPNMTAHYARPDVTALRPYCEAWATKVLSRGVDKQVERA